VSSAAPAIAVPSNLGRSMVPPRNVLPSDPAPTWEV